MSGKPAVSVDFARNLERELAEAREEIARLVTDAFRSNHLMVALMEQRDRLLEAISLALMTNGGPIDGADTADGEAYVMVRACAFAGLEAAIAEVKGAK